MNSVMASYTDVAFLVFQHRRVSQSDPVESNRVEAAMTGVFAEFDVCGTIR